ncbi:glycosyltransferase family 39 protein [Candidatus Amesbacteria bacterium]|nr:glycosyltransferase family 39 protein [Candidatus Amesbacteria bacterium]
MKHKIILAIILGLALFLRVYRTQDFLGFWYDQGRDALVIWDLLHKHKFFLIGPTTGIEGIFLGPFYYYLTAPAYLLGNGHPVYPAIWLATINVCAIFTLFLIGRRYFSPATGLIAATLVAFSFELVKYQRWLSNPTPLPLFALIAFSSLLEIIHNSPKLRNWLLLGLGIGLSLQLEAASAIFFVPATLLTLAVYRKSSVINVKNASLALLFFGLTLMPQIIFNFRHGNILLNSFSRFLIKENSFQPSLYNFYSQRLNLYYQEFTHKFYADPRSSLFFTVSLITFIFFVRKKIPVKPVFASFIWWATPLIFLLFYHGNKGYVWGYYFTGIYPVFALIVSAFWAVSFRYLRWSRGIILILLFVFLYQNLSQLKTYLTHPGPYGVSLTSQIQAVDWIYQDASDREFNTDAYVPPMIPYAYDYLFLWRGKNIFHSTPTVPLVPLLYTIQEPDPGHQTLFDTWFTRQSYYSSVEETKLFGPLTVQRRARHNIE